MSSNGVMLQDYVPNAINNLTEQIWCAGAVLPAGKRVVIGHIRDGWLEVTFTMGKTQDFIGMAMVPPDVVGIEPAPYSYGMGMAPRSIASAKHRAGVGDQESPADLPEGWPESAPGMGAYAMRSAFSRARARVAPRSPAIDQSAPLPPPAPDFSPQSGNTFAESFRRARMEQALPADQGRSPRPYVPPYQWGGLHGMMPSAARDRLRGMGASRPGVGAAGASAFTMAAAQALNDHLVTNNCAGCSDMTSRLRQLTFAFKAAVMTDTGIVPQMNLNMSNALAMTAYGSGTDQALKNVLGASSTYSNGPCTDDNGTCLGNLPTPIVPPAVSALEQQFVHAIQAAMQQAPYIPQTELVKGLIQGFAALVNQIGFELAKLPSPIINVVDNKPPPAPPTKAAAEKSIWPTIVIGGLIGTAVLATGAFAYTHARRA